MKAKPSASEKFVREQHRVDQTVPPLSIVAAGLALTLALIWYWHPTLTPVEHWGWLRAGWIVGVALAVFGATTVWWLRRRSLIHSATKLDATMSASNRLETATALQSLNDPLARAQRDETERFLQHTPAPMRRRQLPLVGALALLLLLAHAATLVCWTRPVNPIADKGATAKAAKAEAAKPEFTASIEWETPESEASATAIEEVPLEAVANSTTGLRDATLEVAVNGETRLTQPLPAEEWKQAGKHPLKLSLYLDQLEVKAFDVVSYSVRAQRATGGKLPPTISPVQFVQVKPMREDVFICAGGDKPSKCFNYVTALKAAQVRLMKENFTLAGADISHASGEWKDENTRVGDEQKQLAEKTAEVVELMTTNNYPPQILTLVQQSQPLMTDAAGKIQKEQNQPALSPQGKALGLLTAVEQYLKNSIKLASARSEPKASDPFNKPKNLEVKTHPLTKAGKMDALAKEQARLAGDLAQSDSITNITAVAPDAKDENSISGTPTERQAEINKRISEFLADDSIEPEALKHLQEGKNLAGTSQERLDSGDVPAAREPAAEAARELRQTAAAMRFDDGKTSKNQLAAALRKLAEAAGGVRQSASAKTDAEARAQQEQTEKAIQEAARQLAEAARKQESRGATNAATRLGEAAKLLDSESLKQLLAQMREQPRNAANAEELAKRLEQIGERAAQQNNPGKLSRSELARLTERMESARANLQRLASACNNPGTSGQSGQSGKSGQSPASSPSSGEANAQNNPAPAPSSNPTPGMGGPNSNPSRTRVGNNSYGSATGQPVSPSPTAMGQAMKPEPTRAEQQQQLAENLIDELRGGALDAMSIAPKASADLRKALNKIPPVNQPQLPRLVAELDEPLQNLIELLRTELASIRRPYKLTDQELEQAPLAYRPAVADYFEQLSKDYQPAKQAKNEAGGQ